MHSSIDDIQPVTAIQEGLLIIERSTAKKSMYHEQYVARLHGHLDVGRLEEAWQKTVNHHTILRTIFDWSGENDPIQIVLRDTEIDYAYITDKASEDINTVLRRDAKEGFTIDTLPPHRLAIIKTAPDVHTLLFTYHHLLLDGSSVSLLLNFFAATYNGTANPTTGANNYADYVRWEKRQSVSKAAEEWKTYADFSQYDSLLSRNIDEDDQTYEFTQMYTKGLANDIASLARRNGITLNSLLQVAWAYTVAHTSSVTTICVGSPAHIRPMDGSLDRVVGMCINTLPYVLDLSHSRSIVDIARDHQSNWNRLIEFGSLSLGEIKKAIKFRHYGDPFSSIITFTDIKSRPTPAINGIRWEEISHSETTQYPVSIDVVSRSEGLEIKATYRSGFYDEGSIASLLSIFKEVLENAIVAPMKPLQLSGRTPTARSITDTSVDESVSDNVLLVIIGAWSEALNGEVQMNSNFFDLGGDSISSLQIVSKLAAHGISVSMRDVFDYPTPILLARKAASGIVAHQDKTQDDIPEMVRDYARDTYGDTYDLLFRASNVQSGILNAPTRKSNLYHDQSTFTYAGNIDVQSFERAWNACIENNDSLRMRYFTVDGTWYGARLKRAPAAVEFVDLENQTATHDMINSDIDQDLKTSFQYESEPLLRLRLYKTSDETYVLFLSFHLLVTDGWGFAFMLDDVFSAYEQLMANENAQVILPSRTPNYGDYLTSLPMSDVLAGRQYWKLKFRNVATVTTSRIHDFSNLSVIQDELSNQEIRLLQNLANQSQLSLNSLFQAAWALTLSTNNSSDILFGATISGRLHRGVHYDQATGLYFNDIPIYVNTDGKNLVDLAHSIQNDFQEDINYGHISSYEISNMLGVNPDDAPYESLLVFENYPKVQEDSLRKDTRAGISNVTYWRRDMADIPKTLYVEVRDGRASVKLSYNFEIVNQEEAKRLVNIFMKILRSCIQ